MKRFIVPLLLAWFAVTSAAAQAVSITFSFSGYVTSIIDNGHVLGDEVVIGTPFQGTYTYESTLADSWPDPMVGQYVSETSVMHVNIGAFDLWSGAQNMVRVENGRMRDELSFSASSFISNGLEVSGMVVLLSDLSGSVFSNDALPAVLPPLAAFDFRGLQIEGYRDQGDPIGFAINGIIIPEPSTISLVLLALALVIKRHKGS